MPSFKGSDNLVLYFKENALKLTVCKETIQKTKVTISANKLLEMKLRLNIVWYLVGRLGTQYSISRT